MAGTGLRRHGQPHSEPRRATVGGHGNNIYCADRQGVIDDHRHAHHHHHHRAPVRPRGRSSSSSTNNHSISGKQQRSSSITNSPDPSIITSDAAEPTAAGSRGANCVVMAEPVTRRPPRRTRTWDRGHRSAQRQFITSIITSTSNNRLRVTDAPGVYAAFPWGGYAQEKGATGTRSNAIGARALYSPLSPPVSSTPGRSFGHGGDSPSSTPRASTGAFRRGGQFSTRAYLGHASNTKGPLRR